MKAKKLAEKLIEHPEMDVQFIYYYQEAYKGENEVFENISINDIKDNTIILTGDIK